MEAVGDPAKAEAKVLEDMRETVRKMRELASRDVDHVAEGFMRLREIRSSIYEDLNQILHEGLLVRGLTWLKQNGFGTGILWEWNPRQVGKADEPDLRGSSGGQVLVCAEATASENPVGVIDTRMKKTLEKLIHMEGQLFYFVISDTMAQRARTKVGDRPIQVVKLQD
jgi:hypothetical protein